MKKNTLLLLIIAGITFSSCGEESETSNLENTKQDSEQIEDGVADDVIEFNDGIVARIDMAEVQMAKLMDLDAQDIPANEMEKAAKDAEMEIAEGISILENLKPTGTGGEDFLNSAITHLNNVQLVAVVYKDWATELEIPDSLWTEEMGAAWMNMAEPFFADYEDSYEQLEAAQGNYGSLNDMDIIPSDVTIEELYEESK